MQLPSRTIRTHGCRERVEGGQLSPICEKVGAVKPVKVGIREHGLHSHAQFGPGQRHRQ